MRDIKFRGKEVETDKWVYGKLIENKNKGKGSFSGYHYIVPFDIIPYAGNDIHTMTQGGYPDYSQDDYSRCWKERKAVTISVIEVDNDTVGQYTGLKDKNGKEIYEGDIVAEKGHYVNSDRLVYQKIQWKETYSCWLRGEFQRLTPKNIKQYEIEVIGNIYDNSELLEV